MKNTFTTLSDNLRNRDSLVLATIIKTRGSTPQVQGASAVFSPEGLIDGTLGGGILEGDAQIRAGTALIRMESVIYEFKLDSDIKSGEGAICGGSAMILLEICDEGKQQVFQDLADSLDKRIPGVLVTLITASSKQKTMISKIWVGSGHIDKEEFPGDLLSYTNEIRNCLAGNSIVYFEDKDLAVFIQAVVPLPRLIIAGAGHIGKALANLGNLLEFEVTVIDDRPEFCNKENIPDADHLVIGEIGEAIRLDPKTKDTYIVIVTRGHRNDAAVLRNCIASGIAYLGMIGSRTKIALMRRQFIDKGWATPAQLERLYAPIGLDIQSKTIQEIAISIAAQLVLVRQQKQQSENKSFVDAVVLAAGESKRMGSPKQLLPFGDSSIIETVIQNVGKSAIAQTIVVLGSHFDEIFTRISKYPLTIARNRDYKKGMLSSLQQGLKKIHNQTGSVMILLGDQPMISTTMIDLLIDAFQHSGKGIAVAVHENKKGHPVLFNVNYVSEIEKMASEKSLHDFLNDHQDEILEVETGSPEIHRDIDTIEDYNKELNYRR